MLGNGTKDTLLFEVPPSNYLLYKDPFNFPNPVQSNTRFGFETNQIGKTLTVTLDLLNQNGQIQYSKTRAGENLLTKYYMDWDGKTNAGSRLSPGVYYYRFTIQNNKETYILSNSFLKL